MDNPETLDRPGKRIPLILLVAVGLLPGVQTAVSVYWQWHTPITYPAFKILMIAVPIAVWLWARRGRREVCELVGLKRPNLPVGIAVGLLMSAIILCGYYLFLRPTLDPGPVLAKVRSLGVLKYYWVMAVFISLLHSLFEEYYWRGFVLGELAGWVSRGWTTCLVAGALFGIHHIFALGSLFDWPVVVLATLGTMLAGATWSWMRLRGYSIWDCYVSHVLADLSVMWVGYDLITRAK